MFDKNQFILIIDEIIASKTSIYSKEDINKLKQLKSIVEQANSDEHYLKIFLLIAQYFDYFKDFF